MQDRESGKRGNDVGRFIAKKIAEYLNVKLIKPGSNEGIYDGKRVVIKSARYKNSKYGITNKMLERIQSVIVVREIDTDGTFEIFNVPIEKIKDEGTPTRSKGPSKGKVINFNVSKSVKKGHKIGQLIIEIPEKF